MNTTIEKIDRMMSMIDNYSEDCVQLTYNSGRIIEELAEQLIQRDKKRRTMYLTAMADCKGTSSHSFAASFRECEANETN